MKTPSPNPAPKPKHVNVPEPENTWFKAPYVVPLQTLLPNEEFEGSTFIPQEYLDAEARIDEVSRKKTELAY